MNFTPGQSVIVLDTTHKPAGSGVVQHFDPDTEQYQILFKYPNSSQPESISVPIQRVRAGLSQVASTNASTT